MAGALLVTCAMRSSSSEHPLGEHCKHCNKRIARSAQGAIGAVTRHWQVGTIEAALAFSGSILEKIQFSCDVFEILVLLY